MTLSLRVDHVVIRVRDLDAASRDYAALGFTVTPGGEHPTLGSRNALIAFEDDTYLELIAFKPRPAATGAEANPSAVMRRVRGWEAADDGLVDFALVPSDLEETLAGARQRGLSIEGPFPGSRRRPDGQEVAWQFGVPNAVDLPFLCADVTARELRVPTGSARKHPNGVLGIYRLFVHVPNLAASAKNYGALLGSEPVALSDAAVLGKRAEFPLKPAGIVLVESGGLIAHGALVSHRERGMAFLYLRVKGEKTSKILDPALTHNAPIICV